MTAPMRTLPRELVSYELARSDVIREMMVWLTRVWPPNRPTDPGQWFDRHAQSFSDRLVQAQLEAAILAALSVNDALVMQGVSLSRAQGEIAPETFAGADGSGRPIMGIAYASSSIVATAVDGARALGGDPVLALSQAWRSAGRTLATAVQTSISDTSRSAKSTMMGSFGTGWVRVLTPPSCARCIVLAGKYSHYAADFPRHPGCDCTQMPYDFDTEHPDFKSLFSDSNDYASALTPAEQDRLFGKASAQAIREGADVNQVVNARRGMTTTVDKFGHRVRATTEGLSIRGRASDYLRQSYGARLRKQPGWRQRRVDRPRLLPEEIYKFSGGDRDMSLNLLHKNGYLRTASPRLTGEFDFYPRDREVAAAASRVQRRLSKSFT